MNIPLDQTQHREWKPTEYCDIRIVDAEYAAEVIQTLEYNVMQEVERMQHKLLGNNIDGLDEMFNDFKGKIHELALIADGKLSCWKETKRIYKD